MESTEKDRWILHVLAAAPEWWESQIAPFLVRNDEECLIWQRGVTSSGYGRIALPATVTPIRDNCGKTPRVRIHRVAHLRVTGEPIPLPVLDHTCHNVAMDCLGGNTCIHRRCANPEHLEPKTHRDNILNPGANSRSVGLAERTECSKGHPTLIARKSKTGTRRCRECDLESSQLTYNLVREAQQKLGITRKSYIATYGQSRSVAKSILGF